MKTRLIYMPVFVLAAFCAPARGAITVTITPSSGSTGGGTYASGSDIAITTDYSGGGYSAVQVTIGGPASESIGNLSIVATSNIPVTVTIKSGVYNSLAGIASIDTAGSSALVTLIEVRSATIGSVHAGYINGIYASSTIGAITSDTDIYDVVSGGFRGDILAESGSIYQLSCSTGTVGTSGSPISIRAANAVGYVLGTSVYADISGPTGDLFAPAIGRVQTSSGPFVGSIRGSRFDGATPGGASGVYVISGNRTPTFSCRATGISQAATPTFAP